MHFSVTLGRLPKSALELQSIKDSGYKSPTLTVDMMMIQMDLGLLPQARVTFEEAGYKKESDVALQEAYGRLLILSGIGLAHTRSTRN